MKGSGRLRFSGLVALVALAGSVGNCGEVPEDGAAEPPPNIVLIVTDDQRWDTLWAMPNVRRLLVGKGVRFESAFVVNSTCCPSRASILTGRYSHATGMYTNGPPTAPARYGGFEAFRDHSTLATWLDEEGYNTALVGRYFVGYLADDAEYVPPGWDRWFASIYDPHGNDPYFGLDFSDDGHLLHIPRSPKGYLTDVLTDRAVGFIRSTTDPLFLYFTPLAPHPPATIAPRHRGKFSNLPPWRPASYNERDLSDKPRWLKRRPRLDQQQRARIDRFRRRQYRALLAVDEAVGRIVHALEDTGRLDNTMILFMSDNGIAWGEHRLEGKQTIYEETIRIPFVVRYDGMVDQPRVARQLVLNIDVAPTVAALAGIEAPGVEGRSIVPALTSSRDLRADFLVEHLHENSIPTYCAVRTRRFIYAAYKGGDEELYDLRRDPLEMRNVVSKTRMADERRALQARLRSLCEPPPPGYEPPAP